VPNKQKIKLEKEGWELLTTVSSVGYRRNGVRIKTNKELLKEFIYITKKYKHVKIGPSYDDYENKHWGLKGIYIKRE